MTDTTGVISVPIERLREFGERVYGQLGLPPEDAATVVAVQLEADLRGVDTHGFQRLPWYAGYLRRGENNPRPSLRVISETPVSVLLDGDNGLGQLLCTRLMERTIAKARESGLALGALRHSNDWGCGAYYPMMAAAEGFVSFCTTTSVPLIAPFGGVTRLTGNNPMAFAVPRRDGPPVVLDMALTPVAIGKVLRARAEGAPIPQAWGFLDRAGRPTTEPEAALEGVIPAIGGYKGTGLSQIMNLLAGALPGGSHSAAVERGKRGQFFLVISADLFGAAEDFSRAVDEMARAVKASERLPGVEETFVPGEIEQRHFDERRRRGAIPYPASVLRDLRALAEESGIAFEVEG